MRKLYLTQLLFGTLACLASGKFSSAQCPAGSNTAKVNWDNLDYLSQTGTYSTFVTAAMMQNQRFTLGVTALNINMATTLTTVGENTTHTGETGSFGAGADVQYSGNGALTITFDTAVYNFQFSLYDIDVSQVARVTATDAVGAALNVTMATAATGTLTITGSGTTVAQGTATTTALATTDNRGTLNVTVAGNSPATGKGVKQVVITLSGTAGDFWLSELTACVYGSFPLDYYAFQKPWTGQPSYYLVTPDNNSVYLMNPLTGVCQWLFSEPASPWLNSLAYDGVNHILYYVMDNPSPVSTNRSLKKYDFNTETISTVVADVRTLGIPLFDMVVESAGAAFYNGSLYLGIEGTNSGKTSNRESIIWKIDFNAAQVPVKASQVFSWPADNGSGTLTHDWGDFIIKDGTLYDFNTGNVGSTAMYIHYNMQTEANTNFPTGTTPAPIQAGQTWDGSLYWTGGISPETGRVARYNENGTIGAKVIATVTACSPAWAGRAGDASDPFKPKSDFGDAPASYDPDPYDKATHEYDCNLRLGASYDREWDKTSSAGANADGADEDGISTVSVLTPVADNFVQSISVYNNTGANATVVAWLDYNGNGIFEAVEGRSVTVASNASPQNVILSWMGIAVPLSQGMTTYLRVRITSAANGLTVSRPNGWFSNGEVEDYVVPVDYVLPVRMMSFDARVDGADRVALSWITGRELNFSGFRVERSADGSNWTSLDFVPVQTSNSELHSYSWPDAQPLAGTAYYRLSLEYADGSRSYSETRAVSRRAGTSWMRFSPNPVHETGTLEFNLDRGQQVRIQVTNASGIPVWNQSVTAVKGVNRFAMPDWKKMGAGVYILQMYTSGGVLSTRIVAD